MDSTYATTQKVTARTNSENLSHGTTTHISDSCYEVGDDFSKGGRNVIISEENSTMAQQAPLKIMWSIVFSLAYIHVAAVYGLYLIFTSAMWQTNVFLVPMYLLSGLGVTAGAHRLWSHRSYKAKLPLRIFLAFLFTISLQRNIYIWCRDHRIHHKHSETDADPHNIKRGFFFAHVGWILCREHPEVLKAGQGIDVSDLLADPVVKFQTKYYNLLVVVCCFILPTIIPIYFWNETFVNSLFVPTFFRICLTLNVAWFVNSAAHMWGYRPYDATIKSSENIFVTLGAIGEGFHNYHHTFPYDYATSEFGVKYNITTAFIDLMAWLGLAYDRKVASRESIKARKLRTGVDRAQTFTQDSKFMKDQ